MNQNVLYSDFYEKQYTLYEATEKMSLVINSWVLKN